MPNCFASIKREESIYSSWHQWMVQNGSRWIIHFSTYEYVTCLLILSISCEFCSPGPVCCDNDYWSSSEEILSCHDIMVMAQYAPCWQIEANNGRDMNVETRNGQRDSYCEVKSQSEGSDRSTRPIRGSQCDTWQVWHDSSVTQWSTQVWWHAPPLIQIHRE